MDYQELEQLFRDLLASNRGPGYGISVNGAADDLSRIDVTITFISGRKYCCAEQGCHLPRNTKRVVQMAVQRSLSVPDNLVIHCHCCVEEGAKMESGAPPGMSRESEAYKFDYVTGPSGIIG
jgi:hypothetical protein